MHQIIIKIMRHKSKKINWTKKLDYAPVFVEFKRHMDLPGILENLNDLPSSYLFILIFIVFI